jgi:hypothetical protein
MFRMSMIDRFKSKTLKHSLKEVYGYLGAMEKAINGDMVLTLTPATTGSSAAVATAIGGSAAKFTRTVTVTLKTAAGEVCTFLNGAFAIAVTEVTAGNGTSAIAGSATTVVLTEGVGTITIEYIGAWAAGDTQTLTVTGGTKLGYTIANKTSVDTLIA